MNRTKTGITFFAKFATGQVLLQVLGVLNGFFLLRWLSITEQAKFSVAFSIQNMILGLSDLGFTASIIALVGNRVNDKKVVGAYVQTAKRLRNYLFFIACIITLSILPFIIHILSWSYFELSIILIPVLLAVFWQADCSLYDSTLVMHQKMGKLYMPQIAIASFKLGINFILHITGTIGSFSTLLLNAGGYLVNGKIFKKQAKPFVEITEVKYNKEFKEMVHYLKPLFPSLVFNAFYGQIQIFLISFFGKTSNIAEVAALGRLAQLFIFLNTINSVIITPHIAKTDKNQLVKKYSVILLLALGVAVSIYFISLLIPQFYLFLLGSKYYHLKSDLSIMILGACLNYIGGVLWAMHSARKWVFWWGTWSYMICIISCQVLGIMFLDLSNPHGILLLSVITTSGMLFVHAFTAFLGFRKEYQFALA